MSYALLDSGNQQKWEQFGAYSLIRPAAQAVWKPLRSPQEWKKADALFTREEGSRWTRFTKFPDSWVVDIQRLKFKISPTDFGHVGVFPEHSLLWEWMEKNIARSKQKLSVINLFAYSGGATLAAARAGASVCHLDASKGMVAWARENAALNKMEKAPIRWIVDDALKFLAREHKRGVRYDGIILDPPSFGRGNRGEVFKLERDLWPILDACKTVLSEKSSFVILSSHTPGYTPLVLEHLLSQVMKEHKGNIEVGEMVIPGTLVLPSGSYARWSHGDH